MPKTPWLALLALFLPGSQALAQGDVEAPLKQQAESGPASISATPQASQEDELGSDTEPRWFAFQESLDLSVILAACSGDLGLPLEFGEGTVEGRITISSGPGLTTTELWALANRHLATRGLACVQGPSESTLSIVPLKEARLRARLEDGGAEDALAGYIKVIRTLKSANAGDVADSLQTILASEGSFVTALPQTGQLILSGMKPQVLEALRVVDSIEAVRANSVVESIEIRNLSPTELASLVDRVQKAREKAGEGAPIGSLLANPNSQSVIVVAPQGELATWRELIDQFDKAQPLLTQHYAPRRFGLDETSNLIQEAVFSPGSMKGRPISAGGRIVRDELTGTLIVTATFGQHREINGLLDRLENTPAENQRSLRTIPVKHRDVEELLDLMRSLLEEDALIGPPQDVDAPPPSTRGTPRGSVSIEASTSARPGRPVRNEALGITLSNDPGTNRIIAVGPPHLLDQLTGLVEQLDIQSPQVLVEALIVTLTDSQTLDLGVELQKGFRSGDVLFRLQSLFGLGSPDPGATSISQVSGSGLSTVVLDPGDFSGVVRALETINQGRSLTMPKVLVNNNAEANLDSILQTPYTTTSLSTSTTITTFGGTLDAGTTIRLRPQITEGDKILINYSVALSSFVGDSVDPSVPPPRQETSLQSTATIPDGFAVVIGGLDIETEGDSTSQIPILGDLPLIGTLFQNRSQSTSQSRFFVFLRCSVLRSPLFEDLRFVSADDIAAAQIKAGAPQVRPQIMR